MKADIEAALVAKLERHFNERPLSEVHDSGGGYRHPSAEGEEARNADPAQIEGLHLALITTMLCGRPVVATDVGQAEVIVIDTTPRVGSGWKTDIGTRGPFTLLSFTFASFACYGFDPFPPRCNRLSLLISSSRPPQMNVRIIQIIIGVASTFFFLALALYHAQLRSVADALAHASPTWIGAAIVAYAANLLLRARRWQIILRPVAAIPYRVVASALLVGYGLNTIMPARLGELFRAEFFKQSFGLSRVWALTSIVIERLFDGLTVVTCLGFGLFLTATTREGAGIVLDVLATGGILFGAILLAALCLSGSTMSRALSRVPGLSARVGMVQRGFGILRTWRTLEIAILTLIIYLPDALSLWFLVKAVGLALGFGDTLVLVGMASLSTVVPSGPAFLGTLQFAYMLAIGYAGGPRAVGIAAAALAQLCLLLPVALIATGILTHGSGRLLAAMLKGRSSEAEEPEPKANEVAGL